MLNVEPGGEYTSPHQGRPDHRFQNVRTQFDAPEHTNDSPFIAPFKHVLTPVPGYQKPSDGTNAALRIGLDTIRGQCPHFADWLIRLERLLDSH